MTTIYTIPKVSVLGEEVLSKVWKDFLDKEQISDRYVKQRLMSLDTLSSYGARQIRFRDWLWSQGGSIKRRNKKFCIEFTSVEQATMFMLKHV